MNARTIFGVRLPPVATINNAPPSSERAMSNCWTRRVPPARVAKSAPLNSSQTARCWDLNCRRSMVVVASYWSFILGLLVVVPSFWSFILGLSVVVPSFCFNKARNRCSSRAASNCARWRAYTAVQKFAMPRRNVGCTTFISFNRPGKSSSPQRAKPTVPPEKQHCQATPRSAPWANDK